MPLQKLQFRPGVNREGTTLSNEGGWFDCDKIRFRSGYPEKIGGWAALAKTTFLGVCRSLWNWVTLGAYNLIGVGTNLKFYVYNGGTYNDITPIRLTTGAGATPPTTPPSFTTIDNSATVTVNDPTASGLQVGDFVTFSGADPVAGLDLNGEYQIVSLLSSTEYTITALGLANTGTTGGGTNVTAKYQINTGSDIYSINTGWGVGPWSPTVPVTLGADPVATTNGTNVVTVTQSAHGYIVAAGDFVIGTTYKIVSAGSTDFTTIGATSNAVGTVFTATGAGSNTTTGTAIIAYVNISGVGAGSYTAGSFITGVTYKIVSIGTPATDFTLIGASSNTVGITFTATGAGTGAGTATVEAIGGIPVGAFNGTFEVIVNGGADDPTTNTYSVYAGNIAPGTPNIATIDANASVIAGGSSVVVAPEYAYLSSQSTTSRAWGAGFSTGIGLQLRLWSQSNFGQDLLFNPRGGAIYIWQPTGGVPNYIGPPIFNRGSQLGAVPFTGVSVPTLVNLVMVSDATRITIAFGCNDIGSAELNPLLIRWSAQENYLDWLPSSLNQAGGYQLSHGSTIVSALQTRQEILVWTDASVYSMQYLGPPSIYGFNILADNISIASPNAVATASGVTYWMGVDKFYVYSGRVETLPCSVRTYVYDDINLNQAYQFFASTNEGFSEIWWFYCSISGPDGTGTLSNPNTVIDRYVIFNYLDRVWYYGTLGRTAWIDSPLNNSPIAASYDHILVNHEFGVNDASDPEDPKPIACYVQSSDFDIGDGHNYGFVWQIIPDITFDGSDVPGSTTAPSTYPVAQFTVRPRRNPGADYGTADTPGVATTQNYAARTTYNVQQFTQVLSARLRGRQMAFRVSSDTLGTQWQLGTPRLNVRPDGRK